MGNLEFAEVQKKNYKKFKGCKRIWWAFVVTSTQNHQIIHLLNIIEILNKFYLICLHCLHLSKSGSGHLFFPDLLATEWQSHRVTDTQGYSVYGWLNFFCLISINSPTCFARRGKILRWCVKVKFLRLFIDFDSYLTAHNRPNGLD